MAVAVTFDCHPNTVVAPTDIALRYPYIDPLMGAADGLYCQTTTLGNFTSAIGGVKTIPLEDFAVSWHRLDARVSLNAGLDSAIVDLREAFNGYLSSGLRTIYGQANDEQHHELFRGLAKDATNSEKILSYNVENESFDSSARPFVLHLVVHSDALLENAESHHMHAGLGFEETERVVYFRKELAH